MKKRIGILLAALLVCTLSMPVFAEEDDTTNTTTLQYSVDESYVVTIPETVSLNQSLVISSELANTEPNMAVKVRISNLTADGKAELARTDDTTYTITAAAKQNGASISNDSVVAVFADVTEKTEAAAITFDAPSAASGAIKAGSYSGTLTFTISYEEE